MGRIATKNVREKAARGDGLRVLVMTLWPRGVKKSAADAWYKELGTPRPLIRAWKSGRIDWAEVRRGYLRHLKTPAAQAALRKLAAVARRQAVTLLCQCPDPQRCHRSLLQKELQRRARR
ncbi:MAG: DUF488 family protein [Acidobacteria bacterium]|nr:DUF488 family protein [Acidobacteriota bacterium]